MTFLSTGVRGMCASALALGLFGTAFATQAQPASWAKHAIIVQFDHLPRRYSCNDLWYRFRDVLRAIGAREIHILPYECGKSLGAQARSPAVQVSFQLPEALQGKLARWADLQAHIHTVILEPGHPASLDAGDCVLLRQMKDKLFRELPDRVVSFHLACAAPGTHVPAYSLSLAALMSVGAASKPAAKIPSGGQSLASGTSSEPRDR